MLTLSKTHQIIIGITLTALLIATRGYHFASMVNLPSATLAIFFLAGLYLRPNWVFPALLALCTALDYFAITVGGVSSFCVSTAYVFLLPAYGVLWFAGRWFAKHYSFGWATLLPLIASLGISAAISELFSSGGFYFFSGRFTETNFTELWDRLIKYFPHQLESLAFWIGVAAIVHIAFTLIRSNVQTHA